MWRPWSSSDICEVGESETNLRVHLSTDAKEIIKNVFLTLMERGNLCLKKAVEETALLTRKSFSTVWKITQKPILDRKKRSDVGIARKLDHGDQDVIRRKIYKMYEDQYVPTLDNLMKLLEVDETNIKCSRTTLWRYIQGMGFKFKKINKRQVLMESRRLQEWRGQYLRDITDYRIQERPIIYLDETWFDTHDTPTSGWDDSSGKCVTRAPSNRGKRITILHAGSENGFVPNALSLSSKNIKDSCVDYHEDTTAELFEDWFKTKLLPNIPPNSVIVMDNASYHSRQLNKAPSSNDTKPKIQEYMYNHDIYFHENYTKKELLEVLKSLSIKKQYYCDELAESIGHTVLRLPPYHCIFNPIEQIWHQLKAGIRRNNISPTLNSSVLALIDSEANKISQINWENCVKHVKEVEKSYMYLKNATEKLVITVDDSSDSETDLV